MTPALTAFLGFLIGILFSLIGLILISSDNKD